MLLFWSEEHIARWCETWNRPAGAAFSLDACWGLAHLWYSPDRQEPGWRRFTVAEAQAIFAGLGLTSAFWKLSI